MTLARPPRQPPWTPERGAQIEALAEGQVVMGAPGSCAACGHAIYWHARSRHRCERCDCRKYLREVA